jgi:hypothetical protein
LTSDFLKSATDYSAGLLVRIAMSSRLNPKFGNRMMPPCAPAWAATDRAQLIHIRFRVMFPVKSMQGTADDQQQAAPLLNAVA